MAHSPDDARPKIGEERWRRIDDLLHAALEREPTQRAAFLKEVCSNDDGLRAEIESLLACDGQEHPMFENGAWPAAGLLISEHTIAFRHGIRVGEEGSLVGLQVDRFRITRRLGSGGMGEVYSAEDTALGRNVALKVLAPEAALGKEMEHVTREAKAASALNHPNVVTVHEVIRYGETPIIVMELIEGTGLRTMCGTPQPLARIVHLGRQIAEALAATHAHGIVHRDIKPENILVRQDGYVKVLDFGLARPITGDTLNLSDGLHSGTLRYMSPEQARGEAASVATDIFSFGLVLYELATGQHAFPSDSPFGAVYAIVANEPAAAPLKHRVPPRLYSLILAMLAKDPRMRPSAEEVARELGKSILSTGGAERTPLWRRPRVWLATLAGLLLTAGGWFVFGRRDLPQFADLSIQPLTSQGGWEGSPALSPDGQSIAFTWTERLDGTRHLYVKGPHSTEPIKLTHSDSEGNIGPIVWSPDGGQIAFERWGREAAAIYSIASTGGEEKKVLDLASMNPSSAIDWSMDGTQLAYSETVPGSNRLAVYLFNLRTGKKRKLTSPPVEVWGDWDPKFSPDGRTVAFKRVTGFWADDIYVVPAAGGAPRRLTADGRGIWGHAWVLDGRSLIVSCQRGSTLFGLWRFPLISQSKAQAERITQGGIDAITPATGRKTNRLAWVNQLWDLNIYRVPISGIGAPTKLIASTLRDQGATYSRDGLIAFISDRSGSREIWLANADGSNPIRITHFNGPYLDHLQWSPDGQRLAFDSRLHGHSSVFIVECISGGMRCGEPQHLKSEIPAEAPSWSADGKFVYFASDRGGRLEVWKQPAVGGQPTQITRNGGYTSHESRDGRWLYFSKTGREGIWRTSGSKAIFDGRPNAWEELVIGPPYRPQTEGWTLTADEIVFIGQATSVRPAAIRAYRIATKHMRSVSALTEVFSDRGDIGVSVSPDSRWVLYSQLDRSGSNVIVADNIR